LSKAAKKPNRRVSLFFTEETDSEARHIAVEMRKSLSRTVEALVKLGIQTFRQQQGEKS